ncbi:MAG: NAD-dependent epimerase/dehydratase family protein [Candidatus Melainabacteria bacterium]|nr:NAD-dependent epimerase/dehydratase family protein [Candidatus Melainabacteria bacterium]
MTKLTVAVSGASGMVGFHLAQHFASRGHTVKALVRRTSKIEALRTLPGNVLLVALELTDHDELVEAMQGVDVVIHAAGSVDPLGRRQDIMNTNVGLTSACLEAAREASVKQFVHISSLSVITGQTDQFAVAEEAQLKYCGEPYADSKVDAEKLVCRQMSHGQMKVTVLRPGFIYGPAERAWMPRLIETLASGKAMLIDGGSRETNVIYIGNLCKAAEASLMNPRAFGQVYNLTDGQQITKKQLFDAICDGLGLPRVTRSVPQVVARTVCELVSSIAPYMPYPMQKKYSRFSRAAFRLAGVNQGFSIAKAEDDLGYVDRIAFADGMKETLKYFSVAAKNPVSSLVGR